MQTSVQDSCRTVCVDSQSPTTQEKPDNGKQRRIWKQMPLIIPSPPLARFVTFKPHIHSVSSVGERSQRICVMWTEQLVDSVFHFSVCGFVAGHSFSAVLAAVAGGGAGKVPFQQFMLLLFSLFSSSN